MAMIKEKYSNRPFMFQWSKITANFEAQFHDAFCTNKKAHFDNVPDEYKVVDGAKEKWCNLLLLDAIIFILRNNGISASTRRTFNQHRVLYECIFEELQSINPEIHAEILEEKTSLKMGKNSAQSDTRFKEKAEKYSYLRVRELEYPWDSMDNVCLTLLDTPPSKAKNKYINMVQLLTTHENLTPYANNLSALVQVIICRVLFVLADAKVSTPDAKSQVAAKRRGSISPELKDEESEGDRSPRQRTASFGSNGSLGSPGGGLNGLNWTVAPGQVSLATVSSDSQQHHQQTSPYGTCSPYMPPTVTPTSGMQSPIGNASPASRKRMQGMNNMVKKRPSLDSQKITEYSEGSTDVLISPVNKYASCQCGSTPCVCAEREEAEFNAKLQMMFGTTASHSEDFQSRVRMTVPSPTLAMSTAPSVATSNMIGFTQAGRLAAPPVFQQLPPLFIPQQMNRFDQDIREQADQSSGLTPTMVSMKLTAGSNQQKISPLSGGRVVSPMSQYDLKKQSPTVYKMSSPVATAYDHTPSGSMHGGMLQQTMSVGCAEKHSHQDSTPYLEDFCLTADEYQLLVECTSNESQESHLNPSSSSGVATEMILSPGSVNDDETVFSFNPDKDLLNSSGPLSAQDTYSLADDDLLDWTPSSSFLLEGTSQGGKYTGKDVTAQAAGKEIQTMNNGNASPRVFMHALLPANHS